jgi:CDP-2,3-bis-(O-geranylgeranyl)-sn-glycerol synthase
MLEDNMEVLFCLSCILQAVVLLIVANGAPIIARNIVGKHFNWPIDRGFTLVDEQPMLGNTKTWLGLLVAIIASSVVASLIGLSAKQGTLFALLAMMGDLFASFTKRRLQLKPSSRSRILDAIPESLLPALVMSTDLGLNMIGIVIVVIVFFLIEVCVSPILYRWHIRKRPY